MKAKDHVAAIEAMLFASGDPVPAERLAQALEIPVGVATEAAALLQAQLNEQKSGLAVITVEDSFQMVSRSEYAPAVRKLFEIKRHTPLSQAAFEVLSVVAYHQPVTKAYIEQVRGVDCSGVISSLVTKGLIAECGRLDLPGRPLLYGTTENFLRCFSFESLSELPPIPEGEGETPAFAGKEDAQQQVLETKMEDFVSDEQ